MYPTTEERKTYADYMALEEGAPYQLIDGELVVSPSPTFFHQRIALKLSTALDLFVEKHGFGVVVHAPMDVFLSETEAYQPDVLFISKERMGIIGERINGAPDLVVEVLFPSTGYYDLTKKKRVYAESGVKEYWIVDPQEQTVDVIANEGGAYRPVSSAHRRGQVRSDLLDGFTVDLEHLFALWQVEGSKLKVGG